MIINGVQKLPEVETRGPISIEVTSDSSPWRELVSSFSRTRRVRISRSSASLVESSSNKDYCLLNIY